jgi:hypothetical protein
MKWVGYGLQGIGGLMAVTGIGLFAVGKLVERAAVGGRGEAADDADAEGVAPVGSFVDTAAGTIV